MSNRHSMSNGDPEPKGRRERIIYHAFRVFTEKGFDGASTMKIVELAGVSKSLIYQHFHGGSTQSDIFGPPTSAFVDHVRLAKTARLNIEK